MKLRLPSPERCGVIAGIALAGLALCTAVAAVRMARSAGAPPVGQGMSAPLSVPPNRNFFDGEPTYLPCGHLRAMVGQRRGGGVIEFVCREGHDFRLDQYGWSSID